MTEVKIKEFDKEQSMMLAETSAIAVAEQSKALVQARYIMALKNPRDLDVARSELLDMCRHPDFADAAMYNKPIGGGIVGLSIRFVETAIQCMKNIMAETMTTYDDSTKRIIKVCVTDLESNIPYTKDIVVNKTVERSFADKSRVVLGERLNKKGYTVYIVEATEDEMLAKEGSAISKAIRTLGLKLIPSHIQYECIDLINQITRDKAAEDPDKERKKLIDAFNTVGVSPADLTGYLKHDLKKIVPAELTQLRTIYVAIRDGEAVWSDYLPDPESGEESSKTKSIKDKIKNKRKSKPKPEPPKSQAESIEDAVYEETQLDAQADQESAKEPNAEPGKDYYTELLDLTLQASGIVDGKLNEFLGALGTSNPAKMKDWTAEEQKWCIQVMKQTIKEDKAAWTPPKPPFEDSMMIWLDGYQKQLIKLGLNKQQG